MDDVATFLHGATVPCSFPECGRNVPVGKAKVPGFEAIKALIRRRVSIEDLVANSLCDAHARLAEAEELKLFWFLASLRQMARLTQERAVAPSFFGRFKTEEMGNGRENEFRPRLKRGTRRFDRDDRGFDS